MNEDIASIINIVKQAREDLKSATENIIKARDIAKSNDLTRLSLILSNIQMNFMSTDFTLEEMQINLYETFIGGKK